MKTRFAFLTHPLNPHQIKMLWPLAGLLPPPLTRLILKNSRLKIIPLKSIEGRTGETVDGFILVTPIHPGEIHKLDDETISQKIVEAGKLSEKLGFKILGLGGYFSVVADRKPMLYKHLKIPVTTGSAFTAWCLFEGVFKAARKKRLALKDLTLAILSPDNSLGLLCGRKFAGSVAKIILAGERPGKLERVRQTIQSETMIQVDIESDPVEAIKKGDIVINADPIHGLADIGEMKTNGILCDASPLGCIQGRAKPRRDITVIDGRMVTTPFNGHLGFYLDAPHHAVCPRLAETMLLSFKRNFVNYSLGNNVNPDKLDYIANVASHQGFEVALPGGEIG